jgi:hypothetical protein
MPQVVPFILAATALAGTGESVYQAVSAPDPNAANKAAEQQAKDDAAKQQKQEAAMRQQMLSRTMPDTQAAVGGSLTEAPFAQLTADIAGQPGSLQDALKLLGQRGETDTSGLSFTGGS